MSVGFSAVFQHLIKVVNIGENIYLLESKNFKEYSNQYFKIKMFVLFNRRVFTKTLRFNMINIFSLKY